ncbi:MAG: hypothetical protein ACOX1T_07890 [Saccharofermentanales bacterium]
MVVVVVVVLVVALVVVVETELAVVVDCPVVLGCGLDVELEETGVVVLCPEVVLACSQPAMPHRLTEMIRNIKIILAK